MNNSSRFKNERRFATTIQLSRRKLTTSVMLEFDPYRGADATDNQMYIIRKITYRQWCNKVHVYIPYVFLVMHQTNSILDSALDCPNQPPQHAFQPCSCSRCHAYVIHIQHSHQHRRSETRQIHQIHQTSHRHHPVHKQKKMRE
jgi:hypothetical protein